MNNYIIKTLAYSKQVRILYMDNTEMVKEICDGKNINGVLKVALGRTVSATALISGLLKGNQRISIKLTASNQKHKIFADADAYGNVRGYINDELLKEGFDDMNGSVESLIGKKGYLQVMKDLGMNNIFTGITEMPYGNIVDDFSYYFNQSEQIPTLFTLGLVINDDNQIVLSRGVLVQLLPGASLHLINEVRNKIDNNQLISSPLVNGITFGDIPKLIFQDIQIMESHPVKFFCGCSKDMFYPMFNSLSEDELEESYLNNDDIQVACNICGQKYNFNKNEIENAIKLR